MAPSTALATVPAAGSFTCFPNLPMDLRLLIWESFLPLYRDLKIGCYSRRVYKYASDEILAIEPPTTLLQVCRESRNVAHIHGYFVRTQCEGAENYTTWVDRSIKVLYLSTQPDAFARLRSLPSKIRAVACLWPGLQETQELKLCLLERSKQDGYSQIETVYVGILAIVYDGVDDDLDSDGFDPTNSDAEQIRAPPLYDESGFSVVGLDDTRLPILIESAYELAKRRLPQSFFHHRSASCFLETLSDIGNPMSKL